MVDTKYFDEKFKDELLAAFDNLDEEIEGLLINSENFQALNLLLEKYRGKVKCIYIDPPYNTGGDDFIYKDNYQHSSWLTMMENRLRLAKELLSENGIIFISIDDYESNRLKDLLNSIFGEENFLNRALVWHIPNGTNKGHIARSHEYILPFAKSEKYVGPFHRTDEKDSISEERLTNAPGPKNPTSEIVFKEGLRYEGESNVFTGIIGNKEPIEIVGKMVFKDGKLANDVILKSSWRNKNQIEAFMQGKKVLDEKGQEIFEIYFTKNGKPKYRKRLEYFTPKSVNNFKDDSILEDLNLASYFDSHYKPISLTNFLFKLVTNNDDVVLDFFAGSGTTAHSVINLNKKDKGHRKYILIEMDKHFNKVIIPRIKKSLYSGKWKDGQPQSQEGYSHIFKYQSLEQYEDTLDNIKFEQERAQLSLNDQFPDYLIKYMLDYETSKSLLDTDKFTDPFNYCLEITMDKEKIKKKVNLVETFNYLIGLDVQQIRIFTDQGRRYKVVTGKKNNQKILIVWRNIEGLDLKKDKEFVETEIIGDKVYDLIYLNGDNYLPGSLLIEEQFSKLLFA